MSHGDTGHDGGRAAEVPAGGKAEREEGEKGGRKGIV